MYLNCWFNYSQYILRRSLPWLKTKSQLEYTCNLLQHKGPVTKVSFKPRALIHQHFPRTLEEAPESDEKDEPPTLLKIVYNRLFLLISFYSSKHAKNCSITINEFLVAHVIKMPQIQRVVRINQSFKNI